MYLPAHFAQHDPAALHAACGEAAAAGGLTPGEAARLLLSAAQLGWKEPAFVDSVAVGLAGCASALLDPGEALRALALLAPTRHGPLFAQLAQSYLRRLRQHARVEKTFLKADLEGCAPVLAAIAAIAQAQGASAACRESCAVRASRCWHASPRLLAPERMLLGSC